MIIAVAPPKTTFYRSPAVRTRRVFRETPEARWHTGGLMRVFHWLLASVLLILAADSRAQDPKKKAERGTGAYARMN